MKVNCSYDEMRDIDLMVEHPRNPNKHPDKQVKMLAKIMNYQGWRHPITVSKQSGYVVAGHGRLMAAKLNGWTEVPIDIQDFENEAQEYAHIIADNKIAELAQHDDSMMIDDIKELEIDDFELLGLDDFSFFTKEAMLDDDADKPESEVKYVLEVSFPNDMEMNDAKDYLLNQGYIVKVR